jgi:isoquinoline 1-oxidoreductase beta subunit
MSKTPTLDRRAFLTITAAAGGGLLAGTYLGSSLHASLGAADGSFEPNIWVRIDADDTVCVMLTQLEMGQGVMTAMPMLVAEELDVDWNTIATEWVGADSRYGAGFGGQQLTAGSNSIRAYWRPLREAGAAARLVLVAAAAAEWDVAAEDCSTDKGRVRHEPTGRSLRYGALVDRAAQLPVPTEVTLKEPGSFTLLGQEVARLDIPEKVDGRAVFGIDIQRPDMLVARVLRCPVFGGTVAAYDASRAATITGVRDVVPVSAGLAVVADNYWAASRGLQALADDVTWDEGPLAGLTTAEISRRFQEKAESPGAPARNDGDADAALGSAPTTLERVFEVPYLAHATMEPMNCTAHVQADRCDVWAPTQGQTPTHRAAVAASGLSPDQVFVHPTYMGGGFGRRGEADFVTDAVETSKAVGRPVKVIWSREDDMQHDYYRPYTYVRMWAALDADGTPVAWKQRLVQPSLLARNRPGALAGTRGIDFISVDGAANLPYDIPNVRVEYTEFDPGIPFGFWRSVGASVNGYVVEAFFDEVAAAGGHDPYELRRHLLRNHPRHKAALELAAEKHGWSTPPPEERARGIAILECFGTIVAIVAEVSVSSTTTSEPAVHVHRMTCAVDAGWTVHPDTIRGQMEGGMLYGLTAALKSEITIHNGRVAQSNFHDYPMVRINEAPEIAVHIVPSTEDPGGVGEPSTAVLAGALVNAVAAATGKRIYRMPIRPGMLRA